MSITRRRAVAFALTCTLASSGLIALLAPAATAATCAPGTTPTLAPVSTDEDAAGWTFDGSGTLGHHEWVDGGLHIWTDAGDDGAQQQSAGQRAIADDPLVPLGDLHTIDMDFTPNSGGAPGLNILIFSATSASPTNESDFSFAGTLVNEGLTDNEATQIWWSTRAIPGVPAQNPDGTGRPAQGTMPQIVADSQAAGTFLFAATIGYSLGSNVVGDATIHSITAHCTKWTFDLATETPTPTPTPTPTATQTPTATATPTATPNPTQSTSPSPTSTPSTPPSPTITPAPPSESALTTATEGGITVPPELPAGTPFRVHVGVEHAGTWVFVFLMSTPIDLGPHLVNDAGYVTVTPPVTATGSHRVVVTDEDGTVVGWDTIVLDPPSANAVPGAATGYDEGGSGFPAGVALAALATVLVAGTTILVVRRRVTGRA